jgi:hypothetical protein
MKQDSVIMRKMHACPAPAATAAAMHTLMPARTSTRKEISKQSDALMIWELMSSTH